MSPPKTNQRPVRIGAFKPGDLVRTPLGHVARIVSCRSDGYVDAQYLGGNPWTAETILQTQLLIKVDEDGKPV